MNLYQVKETSVVKSCAISCEKYSLNYELLKTDIETSEPRVACELYSILVVKTESCGDSEYEFVYDVTRDRDTAEAYLLMLCKGEVTPITVRDVLYDCM